MEEVKNELPYIKEKKRITRTIHKYNPKYGDNRECICGHPYHRHFDSYENMKAIGCKYCVCFFFKENIK